MLGSWLEGQGEGTPIENAGTYRARDPEGYEWSFGTYSPGQSWS